MSLVLTHVYREIELTRQSFFNFFKDAISADLPHSSDDVGSVIADA